MQMQAKDQERAGKLLRRALDPASDAESLVALRRLREHLSECGASVEDLLGGRGALRPAAPHPPRSHANGRQRQSPAGDWQQQRQRQRQQQFAEWLAQELSAALQDGMRTWR